MEFLALRRLLRSSFATASPYFLCVEDATEGKSWLKQPNEGHCYRMLIERSWS